MYLIRHFTRKPFLLFFRFYAKNIRFGFNAKTVVLQGIDILADVVAVTMGPKGRNVIMEQFYCPKITKDGFTVAKGLDLKDKFQNIGVKLLQDVAETTNREAGDGTTTAIILARSILKSGFEKIHSGANPFEVRKGVQLAITTAKQKLQEISKPIYTRSEIEQIANISANGDKSLSTLIATAISKVGKDGVIIIKDGKTLHDEIKIVEGLEFNRGYISPHFINSHLGSKVEFKEALVLLSQKKIFTAREVIPSLEIAHKQKRPLVIVTEDIDLEPLSVLLLNKMKIGLQVAAVKAPGYGNYMKQSLIDIATVTGGIVFEDDANLIRLEDVLPQSLGNVDEVIITKKSTVMLRGNGDKEEIKQRIHEVENDLKKATTDYEKKELMERISRLQCSVAVLFIGGSSEVEIVEKKDRLNDALNATRAAIEEGIVPGGGVAFLRCIPALKSIKTRNADQSKGVQVVIEALRQPCYTIANNAGFDGNSVVSKVENLPSEFGYNAMNNTYVNMFKEGIVDPTKVVQTALRDGGGVASLFITAEAIIAEQKEPRNKTYKKNR